MINYNRKYKILLCEGITDGFARAALASSILGQNNIQYTFAYTQDFLNRNKIDFNTLSHGLGLGTKGLELLPGNWEETHTKIAIDKASKLNPANDKPNRAIIIDTRNEAKFWKHKKDIYGSGQPLYNEYSEEFQEILKTGKIIQTAQQKSIHKSLFIHYRLGDIALLSTKDLEKALGLHIKTKPGWICPIHPGIMSFDDIIKLSHIKGIFGTKIILDRFIPPSIYKKFLRNHLDSFDYIHLSSDGFTRSAITIKQLFQLNESLQNIENKLEDFFLMKIKSLVSSFSIGETPKKMNQSLLACANASHWQRGGSQYPFDLFQKCGVIKPFHSGPLKDRPSRIEKIFKRQM